MATQNDHDPSIGDLLRQLINDVQHLFSTELRLFKAEIASNIAGLKVGAGAIALGGLLLLASLFTLLAAFVAWLAPVVGSAALAAFIVAVATGVLGIVCVAVGGSKLRVASLRPQRTIASVRRDAETLKGN